MYFRYYNSNDAHVVDGKTTKYVIFPRKHVSMFSKLFPSNHSHLHLKRWNINSPSDIIYRFSLRIRYALVIFRVFMQGNTDSCNRAV